jgi:sugar phosphate isomerase/epimerase
MFVTINGADTGDTKKMGWDRLIQPLGSGTYDVAAFVHTVRETGYTGPIGFQGFGIKAPPREILTRTMTAWKDMSPTTPHPGAKADK